MQKPASENQGICFARTAGISRIAGIPGKSDFRAAIVEIGNIRGSELLCGLPSTFPQGLLVHLGIAEEEEEESLFWPEFIVEAGLISSAQLKDLISEANQLTAIMVASRRTAKSKTRPSATATRKSL